MLCSACFAVVAAAMPSTAARHLVILSHGLYGEAGNLRVLEHALAEQGGPPVLVHSACSNEGMMTRDGVAAGGARLAAEIFGIVAQRPELESISLVGNSLGGLYARAAAAALYDGETGRVAGLRPDALVTIGTPHLGVRGFTFLPLPRSLPEPLVRAVAGQTAVDLLLADGDGAASGPPYLAQLAAPEGAAGRALAAFGRRRAYCNIVGDFMVPFGTAAIEGAPWAAGFADGPRCAHRQRRGPRREQQRRGTRVGGARGGGGGGTRG